MLKKAEIISNNNQLIAQGIAKREDLFSYFITVVFTKSVSSSFEDAMFMAKGADLFLVEKVESKTFYIACYHNSLKSCQKARALLSYCSMWKGTITFVNGSLIKYLLPVLDCYSTGTTCKNHRAHCYTDASYGETYGDNSGRLIVSCKLAVIPPNALFVCGVPATLEEQLYAKAAERGCHICPLFKPEVTQIEKHSFGAEK